MEERDHLGRGDCGVGVTEILMGTRHQRYSSIHYLKYPKSQNGNRMETEWKQAYGLLNSQ